MDLSRLDNMPVGDRERLYSAFVQTATTLIACATREDVSTENPPV
jgi:hypothetical protein